MATEVECSTPTPTVSTFDWLHAFAVEDLQLSPAVCLHPDDTIERALELSYQRDFSIFPIISSNRNLVGYVSVNDMLNRNSQPGERVLSRTTKFSRSKAYELITPSTDLAKLDEFLNANDFALVTDPERKFVLAVATREDLRKFGERFAPKQHLS